MIQPFYEKAGPLDILEPTKAKRMTFEPSLKLFTEWTLIKDGCSWIKGQVNAKGQPHGICRKIHKNGDEIYEGQWCNGKLSGYGRKIGNIAYYIGDWKDGKRHGQGTIVYSDGTTYVGAFKDDMFHGPGKLTKADGTVYEGEWVQDHFNGVDWSKL